MRLTVRAVASVTWATRAAIAVNLLIRIRWWHPYCRTQADGPGYYAIGIPLPYAEPTGASSMEYFLMPHLYVLDTVVLAGAMSLLVLKLLPSTDALRSRTGHAVAIAGSIALLLVGGWQAMIFTTGWWPVTSIATKPDRYFDYRPTFVVDRTRDRQCYD
jgi:hypothetical protein